MTTKKISPAIPTDEKTINEQITCDKDSTGSEIIQGAINIPAQILDKQNRITEAERFFNLLYGAVTERKYGYLWTKTDDDKITYPFDVSNPDERRQMAQKAIELNDAGADVYYGINLMDAPAAANARVTAEHVTLQTATVTDIDIEGGNHISNETKKYPPTFDTAKSFLPFPASIFVNSGYGLHGLCIYDVPIIITADNRAACEERNKKFLDVIRSRAGEFSKAVDGVGDLPRVLRVPGTRNYKLGISEDAPPCHIVEVNDVRFSPEGIDKQLDALKPVQKTKERPTPTRKTVFDFAEDSTDFKEFRIRKMLDYISVVDGEYDKWLDVGFALFNEGMDCSLWEQWSRTQPNFKEGECERKWNGFHHDSSGITIRSLYQWAVEGGYDAKDIWKEWRDQNPELSNKNSHAYRADSKNTETGGDLKIFNEQIADGHDTIQQWQVDNGAIDPKLLVRLKSEADRIQKVSDFAAAANDLTTQKFLGAFKHYSFFAHITDKFFIDLKRKKEEVVNKVKEYNSLKKNETLYQQVKNETLLAKIAALEPTDSELALTNIDITAIKNKVSTFETKARKAHKHYLEQKEIDELNAKIQAERDAYEQAPPSTQKLFPDCPIDLILPAGVFLDEREGIRRIDWDKPAGRNGRPVISICQNPIVPTKIFREPTKHITQYEVAIRTNKNIWRKTIVDGRTLIDPRKVSELADYGALIKNPAHLAKYFAEIIGLPKNKDKLPEIRCYQQPGWHGDQFIYPTGGNGYIVRRSNIDYDELFSTKGDFDTWKKKFHDISCSRNGGLKRAALGAFWLPPLLRILHLPNFWLHLQGKKNFAKTPLIKFGLSIYGNPAETYLLRTFDSSPKNRVTMAVAMNDLPQAIDELETLSAKETAEIQKSIYDYVSGMDGQKNQKSGDVRPVTRFRGVRISSGERPILDNNAKGGAFKRCITLHITEPLFNDEEARQLHIFCEKNHGHCGKLWTDYVARHEEEIFADFERLLADLPPEFKEFEPAHIRAIAGCTVAFWHARKCFGLEETFDAYHAKADVSLITRLLPTQEEISDTKRGIDLLASWTNEHPKNFMRYADKTETITSAISFTETSGIQFPDGRVAFFPNAFKRICEDELHLPSYDKFLNELFDEGKLICPSRRDKRKSVKVGDEVKKLYMFKAGTLITLARDDDDLDEVYREK